MLSANHEVTMQARKAITPRAAKKVATKKAKAGRKAAVGPAGAALARREGIPPVKQTTEQEVIFDAMLAEMDHRIEDIAERTDRLIAKAF
jgi:hypothetical protein